jgi:hypothetical protein
VKIVTQTAEQLVLQEGSASGIALGAVFALAGVAVGAVVRAKTPAALWIGLGLVVVGIVIILLASSITVDANKRTGRLLYQKKRIVGSRAASYAISDILRIETRRQWRYDNTAPAGNREAAPLQPVLVAQSVIVFKSGQELALDHQKTSSNTQIGGAVLMSGQGKESAMAYRVAEFLGVPFQEIAPPVMGMSGGLNVRF